MVALDAHRLELGEGPGHDPATDLAWWFDIPAQRLFTRHIAAGDTVMHDLPVTASAMAVTAQGRQLFLTEDGRYFRDSASGALELHLAIEADNPRLRPNDARMHLSGAFWISTMGWQAEKGAGMLTEALFPMRAGQLLDYGGGGRESTQARPSGLLIGAEVGRQIAGGGVKSVTLVGQEGLSALYAAALTRAGLSMQFVDADNASRQGLLTAATEIWGLEW